MAKIRGGPRPRKSNSTTTTPHSAKAKKTTAASVKPAVQGAPVDQLEAGGAPASRPLTTLDNAGLVASLESLGVGKRYAQGALSKTFASAPLVQTSPALEARCAGAAESISKGEAVDVAGLVKTALADGPAGARALRGALGAHLEAWDAMDAGKGLLEDVRLESIEQLATLEPKDPAEAMGRMIAMQEAASLGRFMGASYSQRFIFTNEPGLPSAVEKMKVRGGAAIGVSGGVLDVAAATKASSVVLIDVDPQVGNFMTTVCALLVGMDQARPDLDKEGRRALLESLVKNEISPTYFLALAGLPAGMLPRVRTLLMEGWLNKKPPPGTWLTDADKVDHISKLAREGRIVSVIGDWADPAVAASAQRALSGLGDEVGSVNFSNMPDYVKDLPAFAENLKALPAKADAEVVATTFYREAAGDIADIMGSFSAPSSSPLSSWTQGDAFPRFEEVKRSKAFRGARLLDGDDLSAHRAQGVEQREAAFATPAAAKQALEDALQTAGMGALVDLKATLPTPKSEAEIPALIDQVDRALLDVEGRFALAEALVLKGKPRDWKGPPPTLSADEAEALRALSTEARSFSELTLALDLYLSTPKT